MYSMVIGSTPSRRAFVSDAQLHGGRSGWGIGLMHPPTLLLALLSTTLVPARD